MLSIGLDIGTGFVKCVSDTKKIKFPSLYAYKWIEEWNKAKKLVEAVGYDAVELSVDPDVIVIKPVMLGRPATILTDHGSQFYANESEYKAKGATEFEKTLVELEVKHILARVGHPQTNGKLERFHGEIQRKQKWFESIDELIHWWNNIKPHMSLDWDNLETPAKAFARKMPEKGTTVIDEQSGEVYHVE